MKSLPMSSPILRSAGFFLAVLPAWSSAAAVKPQGSGLPLAVIGLDTIRGKDMNQAIIDFHSKLTNSDRSKFDYENLLKKAVNDLLLLQEAEAMQMDKDEHVQATVASIRANIGLGQYLKQNFHPPTVVSKPEIATAFARYYRRFQIRTLALPTLAEAQRRAAEIKSGVSMDSLAKAMSLDTRRYDGGLHPLLHYADIENQLRDIAEKLPVGEMSAPYPFHDAYSLLRVEKALPADPKELPKFEASIRAMLLDEKKQAAWEKFLAQIQIGRAPVINQKAFDRIAMDSVRVLSADYLKGDTTVVIQIPGGSGVTDQAFRTRVSRYVMSDGNVGYQKLVERALKSLQAEASLDAVVKQKGYLAKPSVNAAAKRAQDSCLIEMYIQEMVVKNIKFNKQEFADYYAQHQEDFRLPDQFKLTQVKIVSKDTADQWVQRLNKGTDFKYLASQIPKGSTTQTLVNSSEEWVTMETLPANVQRQMKDLPVGGHSGAYGTTEGWVIFNVEDRRKGRIKTMEEVDMQIRQVMFQRKFKAGLDAVLATLKKNSNVVYFQENIRNYFGKSI